MKKNVGKTDKLIRISLGIVFGLLALFVVGGALQLILSVAALIMFFTAYTGFCGLYTLIGVNTCKFDQDTTQDTTQNKEQDTQKQQ